MKSLKVIIAACACAFAGSVSAATFDLSGTVPDAFTPGAADHVFNVTGDGDFAITLNGDGDLTNANDEFRVEITLASGSIGEQSFEDGAGTLTFTVADDAASFGEAFITVGCGSQCGSDYTLTLSGANVSAVPLPAAAWLFLTAIAGLFGVKRLKRIPAARSQLAPAFA